MRAGCLDDALLLDIGEGRRSIDGAVEVHIGACVDCRMVLAAAARGAESVADARPAALHDEPAFDELGVGVVVGSRYRLERFVGMGGMGVVWAARREADGAAFALKIARGTDPELFRRFEREASVLRALDHPNVLRPIEVIGATAERGIVLVLPLLVGETLEARLARDGPMNLSDVARVLLPVVNALTAAHARGVIHRDVKPQNVFLSDDRVIVLDFGVAKLTPEWGPESRLTRTGAVLGTPRYMAPEQIFGERNIDARADVWGLGAVLFRALAGCAPIRGTTVGEAMRELRRGTVEPLRAHVPSLPADVLEIVDRALTVPREQRLNEATAFARVLARYWRG